MSWYGAATIRWAQNALSSPTPQAQKKGDDCGNCTGQCHVAPCPNSDLGDAPQAAVERVTVEELADDVRMARSMWSSKDGEDSYEYAVLKQCLEWIAHNKPNVVIVEVK